MSVRRVGVLLVKEFSRGARDFIFILAIVVPILLSLVINLLFGSFFSDRAKMGLVDQGQSQLTARAADIEAVILRQYEDPVQLEDAVSRGAVDLGVVLPAEFDRKIAAREPAEIIAYVWGESALKHRAVLGSTLLALVRDAAGYEPPVEIVTTTLGEVQTLPWEQRLLPLLVLLSIMIGGLMIPATSMAQERQDRTLSALTITPASLGEVLASKGLLAVIVSSAMALVTLALNRAFGGEPVLLISSLILGASMAAVFGLLLGVMAKNVDTLFATIKSIGIFLYAPALIYMFPEIPQWIGRILPTHYVIQPVIEIVQEGAGLQDVLPDLLILAIIIAILVLSLSAVARRKAQAVA